MKRTTPAAEGMPLAKKQKLEETQLLALSRTDLQALLRAVKTPDLKKLTNKTLLWDECLKQGLSADGPRRYVVKGVTLDGKEEEGEEHRLHLTFIGTTHAEDVTVEQFFERYPGESIPREIAEQLFSEEAEACGGCEALQCKCCSTCERFPCNCSRVDHPEKAGRIPRGGERQDPGRLEPPARKPELREVSKRIVTCCQEALAPNQLFCHHCGQARPDRGWCATCQNNVGVAPGHYCGSCGKVVGLVQAAPRPGPNSPDTFDTSHYPSQDRKTLNSVKPSVLAALAADRLQGSELWNFASQAEQEHEQELKVDGGRIVARRRKGRITSELQFTCALGNFTHIVSIIKPDRRPDLIEFQNLIFTWMMAGTIGWRGAEYYVDTVRGEREGEPLWPMSNVAFSVAVNMPKAPREHQRSTHRFEQNSNPGRGAKRHRPDFLPDEVYRKARDNNWCLAFQAGKCRTQSATHEKQLRNGETIRLRHLCAECKGTTHGWSTCPTK